MKLVADENLNNRILRGIKRIYPNLDVLRIQDTEIAHADDPTVLHWCDLENRILLTHDFETIPMFAYARMQTGARVAGIIMIPKTLSIGAAITELSVVIELMSQEDWVNRLQYLPI